MPPRRKASIRFWQTGLFVAVIVVAILILSGSLSAGLQATLTEMGKADEARNASALARRLEPEFPLTPESRGRIEQVLIEYRSVYDAGIWVYDRTGLLVQASYDTAPTDTALEQARNAALAEGIPYSSMELRSNGWAIAARTVHDASGARAGVVVSARPVDDSLRILRAVRDRLWITFWVSLVVAGLLGFMFSELIRRRVRGMLDAADAIAAGDFDQRLPVGLVPDEIQDLALAYNRMGATLGKAFGEIEESHRQLAAVVESMAEGVAAFDAHGAVRVINPEAMRLLGTSDREDMLGAPVTRLTGEPEVIETVEAALSGHGTARIVTRGAFTVLLNCTTLYTADEEIDGAVLLLTDVTEQRRIEAAQRRFVSDASHELRTPIAGLKGILELLADGAADDSEVRDDFIATMQVETDRLGRLVTDLLTLAKLDAGSLRLSREPVGVVDMLDDVVRVMQTLAEQAKISLRIEAEGVADAKVLADRDRVVQVLLSFTDNALKHSGPQTTVHLRACFADERGQAIRLEVADEGPGIGPEQLERVFERFYQADDSRPGGGGAGLGLAIAKEIVEAHGSRIEVESEPGRGTTFAFELLTES